tara:strand:+ start:144 stop:506 length:363 start_codon:yes stop_codon:yes gene_type:complete
MSKFTKAESAAIKRINAVVSTAFIDMLRTSPEEEKVQMMVTELATVFVKKANHMLTIALAADVVRAEDAGASKEYTNDMRVKVFEAVIEIVSAQFGFSVITKGMSNDDYEVIKAYKDGAR